MRTLPLMLNFVLFCVVLLGASASRAATLDVIPEVEPQPLLAQATRLASVLEYLGSALREEDAARLTELAAGTPEESVSDEIQEILDAYCLAGVNINPEARVKVMRGPADAILTQHGWKNYLIKVHNESGTRAQFRWQSPNAEPVLHRSTGAPRPHPENAIEAAELESRFLELALYDRPPMSGALSGADVEYRVLQIYTTAEGPREAEIGFHIGQGTQDLGFRSMLPILFECLPSVTVTLRVRDHDGEPAMASFIFRDNVDRLGDEAGYRATHARNHPWQRPGLDGKPLTGIYPLPSRRVADRDKYPDFFFQPQIYRQDGEDIMLPPGQYDVTWTRGPEYVPQTRTITVPEGVSEHEETFELKRWIHLAGMGWYSGDHHVHAGGCSHYESPAAGVKPEAMLRQAKGEDLNVSCVLTWGPCWYHQKSFFEGKTHVLSTAQNLMRYDVEVSGFPSSHAGHLCLLRLKEDDYPGTTRISQWPSWTLPVLKWGKSQGAVVGYSHSGWGLEPVDGTTELPNFSMPKMDGIGANEFIVTVVHDMVDFISAGDTPLPWEMNIWYHTLNCGFRTAISGETDYPCIYDDRIGMARSYAKLEPPLSFDAFADAIRDQTVYVSDGMSHLMDFKVSRATSHAAPGAKLALSEPGPVTVSATVAALLSEEQTDGERRIQESGPIDRPFWHIEKARVPQTRNVTVELILNGKPVAWQDITADGTPREVNFEATVERSSWMALRVMYSSHTNPVYITLDGAPIRASKHSAYWCRQAVDQCWTMKSPAISQRDNDFKNAEAAYDHAREVYDQILAEAHDDLPAFSPARDNDRPALPEGAVLLTVQSLATMMTPGWDWSDDVATAYEGQQLWAEKGEGERRYRWLMPDIAPGRYTISAWVSEDIHDDHATDAPYTIDHGSGTYTVRINQKINPETWHELGTYDLTPSSSVELTNDADDYVVADALLLVPAN